MTAVLCGERETQALGLRGDLKCTPTPQSFVALLQLLREDTFPGMGEIKRGSGQFVAGGV